VLLSTPASEVAVEVTGSDQQVQAFDGEVRLVIPAGAIPAGWVLTLRRLDVPPAGQGLRPVSRAYAIDLSGPGASDRLNAPITVILRFDPTLLQGIDLRKLGLCRESRSGWVYLGGVVNPDAGTVRVQLDSFSTFAVMVYEHSFADLQGHWSEGDVAVLVSRHLVHGVSPTAFEPDRPITRAELAKLLVAMLGADPTEAIPAAPTFKDVAPDAWYYAYVEAAARLGLVKGSDGLFRPDNPVAREEMAAMLLRAMGLEAEALQSDAGEALPFDDADEVSAWTRGYMAIGTARGLLRGVTPETLQPRGQATRAQAAVLLLRAMSLMGLITGE